MKEENIKTASIIYPSKPFSGRVSSERGEERVLMDGKPSGPIVIRCSKNEFETMSQTMKNANNILWNDSSRDALLRLARQLPFLRKKWKTILRFLGFITILPAVILMTAWWNEHISTNALNLLCLLILMAFFPFMLYEVIEKSILAGVSSYIVTEQRKAYALKYNSWYGSLPLLPGEPDWKDAYQIFLPPAVSNDSENNTS